MIYQSKKRRIGFFPIVILLVVGFVFFRYIPNITISFSQPTPEILASGTDPTKSPEGKAPESSSELLNVQPTNSPVTYDLPPQVSNPTSYFALEWIDGSRYASQHPCLDFEIYNCDPTKIVKVKVNCPFRYEDRKYSKWYYFDKNTILLLTPGRYFFPRGYTELYEKIILLPTEDPIKRCEVEVYNLDRIVFIPQAILKYNTVYETYFENSLLFHSSPGW